MSERTPKSLIILLFGILLLMPMSSAAQVKIDLSKVEKIDYFSGTAFVSLPFSKSAKKSSTKSKIRIEGFEIVEKDFVLHKPVYISSTETCGEINGVSIALADNDGFIYRVQKYHAYEFAGKTFAYRVEYEFFDSEGEEIGATTDSFYVDEVGSETFGLRCVKDFKLDRLPDWVKNLALK